MRVLPALICAAFLTGPAGAVEPVDKFHLTTSFNVVGGRQEDWRINSFAFPQRHEEAFRMRFVISGLNRHDRWGSGISFFFGKRGKEDEKVNTGREERFEGTNLRFIYHPDQDLIYPLVTVRRGGKEQLIERMAIPIALNQTVTVAIDRQGRNRFALLIDGNPAPLELSRRQERLTVHVSGATGTISMPAR